jgi:selenophosphate synthetase-related protein
MQEFHITLGENGMVRLPESAVLSLGAKPGDEIVMMGEAHDMRIYRSPEVAKRMDALRKLQQLMSERSSPDVSVVDELIAERRAEFARESGQL